MLCHTCHVRLRRDHPYCLQCGTLRKGAKVEAFAAPELCWADQVVALVKPVTSIGRAPGNDVVLTDSSVSRHHARITRTPEGFEIEDLDSFNGTTVDGRLLHGDVATLPDAAQLHLGDVPVRFAQPRTARIGSKTITRGVEHTALTVEEAGLSDPAPTAACSLDITPRRRSGWALKQVPDSQGMRHWVLRNTRTGVYLQLEEQDVFIWNSLDGENSVRDLLFLYAQRYGELALPRIERTLDTFADAGLLGGLPGGPSRPAPSLPQRIGRVLFGALMRLEVSIDGLDRFFTWFYRTIGWRLFTPTAVVLLWLLIAAGLVAMPMAGRHHRLFDVAGAGLGGLLAVAFAYLVALIVHESAHALAVKSYGRTVTRGGFLLVMGLPFAFVDTSDMWFGTRWSRIVVTLSGPLSTAGLAGACALTAAYLPHPAVSAMAYQLAFGLYLNTAYNLNPLMPLDGYQALSDALRLPRLREQASAYVLKGVWVDLRSGRRPGIRQWGMAAYGLAVVAGTGLFVVMAFLLWRDRLGDLVREHLPAGLGVLVVVLGLGIAGFPIWYRISRKLIGLLKSRRFAEVTAQ